MKFPFTCDNLFQFLSVSEELEDAKNKLYEAENEGKSKLHLELEDAEQRLAEAKASIHRLEKTKNELTDTIQVLKDGKIEQMNQVRRIFILFFLFVFT